jgi:hypothetical protein
MSLQSRLAVSTQSLFCAQPLFSAYSASQVMTMYFPQNMPLTRGVIESGQQLIDGQKQQKPSGRLHPGQQVFYSPATSKNKSYSL